MLLLAVALVAPGCAASEEVARADEAEIREALEQYLPRLAAAYRETDAQLLEGLAAEKEIARVDRRTLDLMEEGRRVDGEFLRLTLEKVDVWNAANAYVTTRELWNIRQTTLSGETTISEELERPYRVQYQLKRDDGRWRVLFRGIQE